jgi:hypothetical protein
MKEMIGAAWTASGAAAERRQSGRTGTGPAGKKPELKRQSVETLRALPLGLAPC